MPAIQSVSFINNQIQVTDKNGQFSTPLVLPVANITVAKAENWINNTWVPQNITGYQMQVHVFSVNPLLLTVITANLGESIPANWWIDQ